VLSVVNTRISADTVVRVDEGSDTQEGAIVEVNIGYGGGFRALIVERKQYLPTT
jgi:hypothetical protein